MEPVCWFHESEYDGGCGIVVGEGVDGEQVAGLAGRGGRGGLAGGFVALVPLWPSVAAIGLAFALVCRASGLSGVETQLLSLLLFAGSAQFTFADLIGEGSGVLVIAGTVLLLNARHLLYGLAINRWLPTPSRAERGLIAALMTDESFAVAEREAQRGRPSGGFLIGAGLSLYVTWNLATLAGVLAGELVDIPDDVGLDFVFPLSFVALTLPLIRTRRHVAAVIVAGVTTVVVTQVANGGVTVLAASLAAVALGAALERGKADGGGKGSPIVSAGTGDR